MCPLDLINLVNLKSQHNNQHQSTFSHAPVDPDLFCKASSACTTNTITARLSMFPLDLTILVNLQCVLLELIRALSTMYPLKLPNFAISQDAV